MKTQDFRALPSSTQETIRTRAVKAVLNGEKQNHVARLFGVTTEALRLWMRRYERGGFKALKANPRGRPRGGKLTPRQAKTIARMITDKMPDQLKLPFALWTREAVAELIKRQYGVVISRWTAARYLKRWGFSPQKPAKRALEQNPELVQAWLETEYPQIKREADQEGAEIHWGDEMGLRSDHQSGTTWGRKGQTPVVPVSGQRFSCNMISALSNRGTLRFMVYKEHFTAAVFIKFLERLVRGGDTKIYLIVDNHSVHCCRKVRDWLAKHSERIRLFYLPPYSPELNPDEYLNNDVKSNAVGRRRPVNRKELIANVRGYLSSTQRRPQIVKSYFRAPQVRYAI